MFIKILNNFIHYVYVRNRTRKDSLFQKKPSKEFIHTKSVKKLFNFFL